jgi:hypothetical protein
MVKNVIIGILLVVSGVNFSQAWYYEERYHETAEQSRHLEDMLIAASQAMDEATRVKVAESVSMSGSSLRIDKLRWDFAHAYPKYAK